jgi:hypothetical protein
MPRKPHFVLDARRGAGPLSSRTRLRTQNEGPRRRPYDAALGMEARKGGDLSLTHALCGMFCYRRFLE